MRGSCCLVVICSHGLEDPLVSTLMFDYVLRLRKEQGERPCAILFVTEGPRPGPASKDLEARLTAAGIRWLHLGYVLNRNRYLQKVGNALRLLWHGHLFARKFRQRIVMAFLTPAGAYASLLKNTGFTRLVLVNFEPHSQYMVEAGIWKNAGLHAKIFGWFEKLQLRNADMVIAPTTETERYVRTVNPSATVRMQGVTVDVAKNARDQKGAMHVRARLGLADSRVFLYVGKFNGLYYSESDYGRFVAAICAADPSAHHIIITLPEHRKALEGLEVLQNWSSRVTLLGPVPPEELPAYISAADIGVIAVPPTPSQIFRSPVKTALYWAAGVPILIPRGVSDDWWIAAERKVGVVLDDLPSVDGVVLTLELDAFLREPKDELRFRCVQAAMELRDTRSMVLLLEEALLPEG